MVLPDNDTIRTAGVSATFVSACQCWRDRTPLSVTILKKKGFDDKETDSFYVLKKERHKIVFE